MFPSLKKNTHTHLFRMYHTIIKNIRMKTKIKRTLVNSFKNCFVGIKKKLILLATSIAKMARCVPSMSKSFEWLNFVSLCGFGDDWLEKKTTYIVIINAFFFSEKRKL